MPGAGLVAPPRQGAPRSRGWVCSHGPMCTPRGGGDRKPGDCAGTDLCPPWRAAALGVANGCHQLEVSPKMPQRPRPREVGCSPGVAVGRVNGSGRCVSPTGRKCVSGTRWLQRGPPDRGPTAGARPSPWPVAGRCHLHKGWPVAAGGSWARSIYSGRRANTAAGTF